MSGTDLGVFGRGKNRPSQTSTTSKRFEGFAYGLFGVGSAADQMSTRYALSFTGIYETNPVAAYMMRYGLWQVFDAMILLATIFICGMMMRRWKFPDRWVLLLFPMVIGLFRLGAAFWNLSLVA